MTHSAFILHGLLELPPAIHFFRVSLKMANPLYASPAPAGANNAQVEIPGFAPIMLSYSLLLLSSSLMAFFLGMSDELSPPLVKAMAGCFALYHIGPIARAVGRIRAGDQGVEMGGPWVHLMTHIVVGFWLSKVAASQMGY